MPFNPERGSFEAQDPEQEAQPEGQELTEEERRELEELREKTASYSHLEYNLVDDPEKKQEMDRKLQEFMNLPEEERTRLLKRLEGLEEKAGGKESHFEHLSGAKE